MVARCVLGIIESAREAPELVVLDPWQVHGSPRGQNRQILFRPSAAAPAPEGSGEAGVRPQAATTAPVLAPHQPAQQAAAVGHLEHDAAQDDNVRAGGPGAGDGAKSGNRSGAGVQCR